MKREHEQDYLDELAHIQNKRGYLAAVMGDPTLHLLLSPAVEDMRRRESRIKKVLRRPVLPPLTDKLPNPWDSLTPEDQEFLRQCFEEDRKEREKRFPRIYN